MTEAQPAEVIDERWTLLRDVVVGMVSLLGAYYGAKPAELDRAIARGPEYADLISCGGDRITGTFTGRAARKTRADVLNAVAHGIAVGAHLPCGVTFLGEHWCTDPHPGCPNGNERDPDA